MHEPAPVAAARQSVGNPLSAGDRLPLRSTAPASELARPAVSYRRWVRSTTSGCNSYALSLMVLVRTTALIPGQRVVATRHSGGRVIDASLTARGGGAVRSLQIADQISSYPGHMPVRRLDLIGSAHETLHEKGLIWAWLRWWRL